MKLIKTYTYKAIHWIGFNYSLTGYCYGVNGLISNKTGYIWHISSMLRVQR